MDYVRRQYWQAVPLRYFVWPSEAIAAICTDAGQREVLGNVVNHPCQRNAGVARSYKLTFLKRVLAFCEAAGADVLDELYELSVALMVPDPVVKQGSNGLAVNTDFAGVTYDLGPHFGLLSVQTAMQLVSDGTTGLRTWEAACALGEWFVGASVARGRLFAPDTTVLELGAGVGVAGLALARVMAGGRVILTDVHAAVLENLALSAAAFLCVAPEQGQPATVRVAALDWANPDVEMLRAADPAVVVGSDLVYDTAIIASLVTLIVMVHCDALIASTLRNEATLQQFLDALSAAGLQVTAVPLPSPLYFFRPPSAVVFLHHVRPPAPFASNKYLLAMLAGQ